MATLFYGTIQKSKLSNGDAIYMIATYSFLIKILTGSYENCPL
jgi:hypothetical protein